MIARRILVGALQLAATLCVQTVSADTLHGKVIAISDGDTLTVLDEP